MTETEARAFLTQFDEARRDFGNWPKWMQDAAREAAATFPRTLSAVQSDREVREKDASPAPTLSHIDDLAKVYASSYASPHHIVFTVEGLRALLASAKPQEGWISVKERLPENGQEVLATDGQMITLAEWWTENGEPTGGVEVSCSLDGEATHWMPRPAPPSPSHPVTDAKNQEKEQ